MQDHLIYSLGTFIYLIGPTWQPNTSVTSYLTSYIVILRVAGLANAPYLRLELINWKFKKEQAREGKLKMRKYRDKPTETNLLFVLGLYAHTYPLTHLLGGPYTLNHLLRYDTAFLVILIPQLQTSITCRCH